MAAPTSLEGRRSCIRKLIMLSDLMSRLQPRKKTPKTTVSDSTQSTAICATRDTHRLRSSGASPAGTPSLADSGAPPGQQPSHKQKSPSVAHALKASSRQWALILHRTAEPQSSRNYQLCKKDCIRSGGNEELVRRSLWDEVSGQSLKKDVVTEKGTVGLCLAFVESDFNITKVNENTDGSFDYGIFQINSHYWCNDYQSHTENNCQVDCQGLAQVPGWERVKWRLHCAGRPLSYWMTGCHL
ncbi:LYZL6, partial [Cervus elaphus hippelaphus]